MNNAQQTPTKDPKDVETGDLNRFLNKLNSQNSQKNTCELTNSYRKSRIIKILSALDLLTSLLGLLLTGTMGYWTMGMCILCSTIGYRGAINYDKKCTLIYGIYHLAHYLNYACFASKAYGAMAVAGVIFLFVEMYFMQHVARFYMALDELSYDKLSYLQNGWNAVT